MFVAVQTNTFIRTCTHYISLQRRWKRDATRIKLWKMPPKKARWLPRPCRHNVSYTFLKGIVQRLSTSSPPPDTVKQMIPTLDGDDDCSCATSISSAISAGSASSESDDVTIRAAADSPSEDAYNSHQLGGDDIDVPSQSETILQKKAMKRFHIDESKNISYRNDVFYDDDCKQRCWYSRDEIRHFRNKNKKQAQVIGRLEYIHGMIDQALQSVLATCQELSIIDADMATIQMQHCAMI
jgi:hypothetical protein